MEPETQGLAYAVYPISLTALQLRCVQRALEHELHRVNARMRDERLGDDTRQGELEGLREMRGLLDKLRRLAPR